MNKKFGPLPIWAWVAIGGTLAYIFWKFAQNQEPEIEGYYPAERAEPPLAEGLAGGSGIAGLGEALSDLAAAGFVPAGSEEAAGYPPEPGSGIGEAGYETWLETVIANALSGEGGGGSREENKGGGPRHTAKPSHGAAKTPKERAKIAAGLKIPIAANDKRTPKQLAAAARGRAAKAQKARKAGKSKVAKREARAAQRLSKRAKARRKKAKV